jgi:nitronate monooxygenase
MAGGRRRRAGRAGAEAGGHRGTFIGSADDALIGTFALVPQLVDATGLPVLAAGGIMDGRGIAAALALGAQAAQLGTAFLTCAESAIAADWKARVRASADTSTQVTRAITGRHARGLRNTLMARLGEHVAEVPPYPVQNALTSRCARRLPAPTTATICRCGPGRARRSRDDATPR